MEDVRKRLEARERAWLCAAAAFSDVAQRRISEEPSDVRTAFQRDRDRIIHSKAFRRLKYKTQVFLSPQGDHYRTRLTHTLEVTQVARTIARALDLNEDLTEAIGLGHDLGHTPFGHVGEAALARVYPGFRHNEQSLRVVDVIERDGHGLNLTDDVRDGILRHSKSDASILGEMAGRPASAEAQIVKISDGIAYVNHDLDDALRAGMITSDDVPPSIYATLGDRHAQRINTLVHDVIANSRANLDRPVDGRQVIVMSPGVLQAVEDLRTFLFEYVYNPVNRDPATAHSATIVTDLFNYFAAQPDEIPIDFAHQFVGDSPDRMAADLVCGMTDRYATRLHAELFSEQRSVI